MVNHPDKINSTLILSDLYIIQTAETTGRKEPRRHSSAVSSTGNPPGITTSRYNPFNSANVTTILSYPSKSDAPITTTWKLTGIEAFERYCKDTRIFHVYPTMMAHVEERVPDSYEGCTLRHQQYESVGETTTQGDIG